MLQRDVLIRQIQQAVQVLMQVLAQVLKLRSEERYDEAIQRINAAFIGLDFAPRPVGELAPQELIDLCRTERGFAVELALGIADLLAEEAEILLEKGTPARARSSAAKAHALYSEALETKGAALPLDIGRKLERLEEIRDAGETSAD